MTTLSAESPDYHDSPNRHQHHSSNRRECAGHGIMAAIMAFIAWVCGAAAGLHCSLLELNYFTDNSDNIKMKIGYWSVENVQVFGSEDTPGIYSSQGRCTGWSKDETNLVFDAFWYVGMTAAMLGLCLPVCVSAAVLFCYPRRQQQQGQRVMLWIMISMCVLVGALNLLLMIGAASDVCNDIVLLPNKGGDGYLEAVANGCDLGPSSYLAVISFVLWNCAGLGLYLQSCQQQKINHEPLQLANGHLHPQEKIEEEKPLKQQIYEAEDKRVHAGTAFATAEVLVMDA